MIRRGRKSAAQTPAPKKEQVYGSSKNPVGSAASKTSASKIQLSESIVKTLEDKRNDFNDNHPTKKVSLATLKAVMRRGMGAYSKSHRPTITGGAPNSRQAWGFARVNKFLKKYAGQTVKAAYVQDDDLMENGGMLRNLDNYIDYDKSKIEEYEKVANMNTLNALQKNGFIEFTDLTGKDTLKIDRPSSKGLYDERNTYRNREIKSAIKPRFSYKNIDYFIGYEKGINFLNFYVLKKGKNWDKYNIEKGGKIFSEEDGLYVIIKDVKEESKYKGAYKKIFDIIEEDVAFYNPYGTEHEEIKGNDFHIYITPRPEGDVIEKIKRLPKVELSEEKYNQGGLIDALKVGMANLKKNGIVLTDNDGGITLIAYNTGNQERQPSLYNKALIYSSVQPIKSASEIIQKFDFQDFEWFSESKIEDYKKTHLIIMNQNEVVYDSNVLAEGGDMGKEITCVNCGWHWNTNQSDEYDKYVCHKCGFDNRTFYDSDPIGTMKKKIYNTNYKYGGMNKIQLPDTESSYYNLQPILAKQGYMLNKIMKPTKSVEEIADEFDVTKAFVEKQLSIGAEHEMEHTYSKQVARDTALHHLAEDPEYYIRLKDMEMRTEAEKLDGFYKRGGAFSRETTCEVLDKDGERQIDKESIENLTECLNDLPQTKSMHFDYEKNDYTPARKRLHRDIIYGFKKDLVCVDRDEPIAILMGGSPASGKSTFLKKYAPYLLKEEIFKVDADEIRAKLPEYRGYNATQTHLETKDIVTTLLSDRNIGIPCRFDVIYDGTMNNTKSYIPLINLLKKEGYKVFIVYIDRVQKDVIVKRALERYKKSGRFVPLEVIDDFFEKGKTALQQLKEEVDGYMIVDGSNSDYKIIERGGEELPQDRNYSKIGQPIKITTEDVVREFKKGGEIDADDPQIKKAMTHKAGAAGGLLVGNRHSEGGIKAINKSTGQPLEMEGGEVVITRDAVSDDTKREFEGEMLSNREILSRINESGGGVSFAEGGDVPNKCACMGKQYKFGGKMMRDNEIVENIMTSHRKLFGIKYPELKPSEVMGKIFGNSLNYKSGGEIYGEGGTLVLINKKIPTFNAFSKLNKNVNPQAMKMAYKQYLNKKYFINFEELPHMLQAALLMGNQKLVDSYINS